MAGTVLMVNGTKVLEGSDKTVININFRQESSLSYLCQGVAALSGRRAASKAQQPPEAPPTRVRQRGGRRCWGEPRSCLELCASASAWSSASRRPGGCPTTTSSRETELLSGWAACSSSPAPSLWWASDVAVHLATCLNLASVVAGSLALAVGLADIPSLTYQPYFIEELCKHGRQEP